MLMAVLVATSCIANTADKGYSINGTINKAEKTLVVLSKITDAKLEILDSAYVSKKGEFSFEGTLNETEAMLYYVTFSSAKPPGVPVILNNGDKVKLEVTASDISDQIFDYTVEGGKYNASMQKLHSIYTKHDKEMLAFNAEVASMNADSVTEAMRQGVTSSYNNLVKVRSTAIEDFIRNDEASPATYFAVRYLFQKPAPKLIFIGRDKMLKEQPESAFTKRLVDLAKAIGPTVEGAEAPEIKLLSPDGEEVALSSLRGQVVLIDFWASWCGPCRKENPNVVRLYNKYHAKGFEIYGVSLDQNKDRWKAAIAKDGLTWKHVSDLKGWKSSAAKLYNVHSIPQTFLIDKEGRIIKAGLRGEALAKTLEQLYSKG